MRLAWLAAICLIDHRSVQSIPDSNFVRFRAVEVQLPRVPQKVAQNRRLEESSHVRLPNPIAEYGIARKFAPYFDDRFNKRGQSKPHIKHEANSTTPEACAQLCVETETCRSWYFDERSACHLYYVTVRGYPLKGVVSGDYDPPAVTIANGIVTNLGGHACICGSQEALRKASTISTRKNLLARVNNKNRSHRTLHDKVHGYNPEESVSPDGTRTRSMQGDLSFDEALRYSILASNATNMYQAKDRRQLRRNKKILTRDSRISCKEFKENCYQYKQPPPSGASTCSSAARYPIVVALAQEFGNTFYHFLSENLVRWATLPPDIRSSLFEAKSSRPHAYVQIKIERNLLKPDDREYELLELLGVPRNAVIFGEAKAEALVLPAAGSCGTPSQHQLLSLRSMLLSAMVVKNKARALPNRHTEFNSNANGIQRGHQRSFTVLLIVRTKSRKMSNARQLIRALQRARMGLEWSENVVVDTKSSDKIEFGTKFAQDQPSADTPRINRATRLSHTRSPRGPSDSDSKLSKSSIANGVTNARRKLGVENRTSNLSFVPHEVLDNFPAFNLRIFNDSALPKTQVEVLSLFSSAAVIIAPHGAGLSNMIVARPCATIIEARAGSNPRCFEHMANRLGFYYHSACGPKVSMDETCSGGTYEADVGRVIRLTSAALRERQGHQRDTNTNGINATQLISCVQNAELSMQSHQEAVRVASAYS